MDTLVAEWDARLANDPPRCALEVGSGTGYVIYAADAQVWVAQLSDDYLGTSGAFFACRTSRRRRGDVGRASSSAAQKRARR